MTISTLAPTVEPIDPVIAALLAVDGLLALAVLVIYTLFAPWWSTKTGVGVFALYWTVGLIIFHFVAEGVWGQGPDWREILLLILLGGVLAWNGVLIIYKQVISRRARRKPQPITTTKQAAKARERARINEGL